MGGGGWNIHVRAMMVFQGIPTQCSGALTIWNACNTSILNDGLPDYLKVTIFCRYIFLRIEIKLRFARTKICDSHAESVRGR